MQQFEGHGHERRAHDAPLSCSLTDALKHMLPEERLMCIMHYEQGFPLEAIGRLLNRNLGEVASRLSSVRSTLAENMDTDDTQQITTAERRERQGPPEHRRDERTVLLVEDESIVALTQRRKIERYGYLLMHAPSGEQAIHVLDKYPHIALAIVDIDLGSQQIDGLEFARRAQQVRPLPIVFLTGHEEPEYLEYADTLNAAGYVAKQAGETALIRAIRSALARIVR